MAPGATSLFEEMLRQPMFQNVEGTFDAVVLSREKLWPKIASGQLSKLSEARPGELCINKSGTPACTNLLGDSSCTNKNFAAMVATLAIFNCPSKPAAASMTTGPPMLHPTKATGRAGSCTDSTYQHANAFKCSAVRATLSLVEVPSGCNASGQPFG
eukprot:CAMPEP_0115180598 /NCGR_PEP_ID=MMETSP0270-20121206/7001_1 /TAXON_ID=71861 /ORGANISM="Scrippsiella trochoidea, Strain CCMP3099" /LENGTH=156 /DNA_ID=CAMNT_0002593601 /DNA_START=175 /DNA_END=646 /DNA_ORIENTATION=-